MVFSESVKILLGKNIKILRKTLVKLEKNDKKTENRVMVSFFIKNICTNPISSIACRCFHRVDCFS